MAGGVPVARGCRSVSKRLVTTSQAPSEDATRRALLRWICRQSGVQESGPMRRGVALLDGCRWRFRTPACKDSGKAQQRSLWVREDRAWELSIPGRTFLRRYCREQETSGQDGC